MKARLRISSGKSKGMVWACPKGLDIRPTSGKVRQGLFNYLGGRIQAGVFLDLFAGSGIVGMEAVSRGAPSAVLVEKNRNVFAVLKKNLRKSGFEDRVGCVFGDVLRRLPRLLGTGHFANIFMDPPYHSSLCGETLLLIAESNRAKGTWIITETFHKNRVSDLIGKFQMVHSRKYGDTVLAFWR